MGLEAFRQEWIRIAGDPVSRACLESPHSSSIDHLGSLRGKATADGESASVTDATPAHDSAGRRDPVDLGLPFQPPLASEGLGGL